MMCLKANVAYVRGVQIIVLIGVLCGSIMDGAPHYCCLLAARC